MFKWKVEKFLENYRADLSYYEEMIWRVKVIITEKAVVRKRNELKAANLSRKDKKPAPVVKDMFDDAKAQELLIENLPEPPEVSEIEEKLESLKKFNKKLLNVKKKGAAGKDSMYEVSKVQSDKTKNVVKVNENADTKGNDVEKRVNEKKMISTRIM